MFPTFDDAVEGLGDIASYYAGNLTGRDYILSCLDTLTDALKKVSEGDEHHSLIQLQFRRIRRAAEKADNTTIVEELTKRGF